MSFHMHLTPWRKKQAALLYYFASNEYLLELYGRVIEIQRYADDLLDKSRSEGRDRFLQSERWGQRHTSENWSNHAWSFLFDLSQSLAKDLAARASEIYSITGVYECIRGMSEFSMDWTTPTEQDRFDSMLASISKHADYIDKTMNRSYRAGRWNDFGFALAWKTHASRFLQIPKMVIREDIETETGAVPPKSGVYISTEHPDGALQFAWTGNDSGRLKECATFNALGKKALADLGRLKLWLDQNAMLSFVHQNSNLPELNQDSFYEDSMVPDLAPGLIARNAFTSAPSRWCYVELLRGECEAVADEINDVRPAEQRFEPGTRCNVGGFYFTPAAANSRKYFEDGVIFPNTNSTYGNTIWQWDEKQD